MENRNCSYPLAFDAPVMRVPVGVLLPREISLTIRLLVSTEFTNLTDTYTHAHTHTHTPHDGIVRAYA